MANIQGSTEIIKVGLVGIALPLIRKEARAPPLLPE